MDLPESLTATSAPSLYPAAAIFALAANLVEPIVERTIGGHVAVPRHFSNVWPIGAVSAIFVGSAAFGTGFGGMGDFFTGLIAYFGRSLPGTALGPLLTDGRKVFRT